MASSGCLNSHTTAIKQLLALLADDIPGYSLVGVGQGRAGQAGAEVGAEEDRAQARPAHRAGHDRPGSPGKQGHWFGEAADAGIVLNAARHSKLQNT